MNQQKVKKKYKTKADVVSDLLVGAVTAYRESEQLCFVSSAKPLIHQANGWSKEAESFFDVVELAGSASPVLNQYDCWNEAALVGTSSMTHSKPLG